MDMKKFSLSGFKPARGFNAPLLAKGLLLVSLMFMQACSSEDVPTDDAQPLRISADIEKPASRAINRNTGFVTGDEIGLMMDDGAATSYDAYTNLCYTCSVAEGKQTWQADQPVLLLDTKATVYAYAPYRGDVSASAIEVDMTEGEQTDWLYATPVSNINKDKADVKLTFNHMLANVRVFIDKSSYTGDCLIGDITLESPCFAAKGTFNAAQTTPGYTAFEDEDAPLVRTINAVADGSAYDIMVIPTGISGTIKFSVTVDGVVHTAETESLVMQQGCDYEYTLTL